MQNKSGKERERKGKKGKEREVCIRLMEGIKIKTGKKSNECKVEIKERNMNIKHKQEIYNDE